MKHIINKEYDVQSKGLQRLLRGPIDNRYCTLTIYNDETKESEHVIVKVNKT